MKNIIIASISENRVIGNKNRLIWKLPDDLKRFKKLTLSQVVIMGRKTFESLGKPLIGRKNIIISRNFNYKSINTKYKSINTKIVSSLEEAFENAKNFNVKKSFIIGGSEIYTLSLPLCDKLKITKVHHNFIGDALFPIINKNDWKKTSEKFHPSDKKHCYSFSYINYKKK